MASEKAPSLQPLPGERDGAYRLNTYFSSKQRERNEGSKTAEKEKMREREVAKEGEKEIWIERGEAAG